MVNDILIMLGAIILNCLLVWIAAPLVFRRWHVTRRDVAADQWADSPGDGISVDFKDGPLDRRHGNRRREQGRERRGPDRRKNGLEEGAFKVCR